MSELQIALDECVTTLLGDSVEEMERSALEAIILDLYRRREISVGLAAQLLGVDQLSFIRWSGDLGVPFFDMTSEEWQQELRTIDAM